jgi:hypothetical protein
MNRVFAMMSTSVAAIAFVCAGARAQSISGSLDVVDQQSVLGWACYTGDPDDTLDIELWAVDQATGAWMQMTTPTTKADKGRIDVGNAGVCGSGPNAYYHGFEEPVHPDIVLKANATFNIYAYHRPTGQFIGGSPRNVSFPVSGLPTSGDWRTDLDPGTTAPALMSCIWPFLGANSRSLGSTDPLWIAAGATWPGGTSYPLGYSTTPANNTLCINYDVNAPFPSWAQSNSATNAPSWPTSNYWVVGANYEPAYSLMNSGPPNQSQPINTGGVYSVSTGTDPLGRRSFRLAIDNSKKPIVNGAVFDGIPFLSVGSQMGHGTGGPLAVLDPATGETYLRFDVTKNIDATPGRLYHFVGMFIEAIWGGQKRMTTVVLQQQDTTGIRGHWDWNVYPSYFYPGAEIDYISVDDLYTHCGIYIGDKLDGLPGGGFTRSYSIPLNALFQCAGNYTGWGNPMPNAPVFLTGVHFGMETPDGDTQNYLDLSVTGIRLEK